MNVSYYYYCYYCYYSEIQHFQQLCLSQSKQVGAAKLNEHLNQLPDKRDTLSTMYWLHSPRTHGLTILGHHPLLSKMVTWRKVCQVLIYLLPQ